MLYLVKKIDYSHSINFVVFFSGQTDDKKAELKVTQRLRLDQHKLEDLEKKLRTSVTNALSNNNTNGQSSPVNDRKQTNPALQTKFSILITTPKTRNSNENTSSQRKSNGRTNSPSHPSSSDENDDRAQSKKNNEDDDESSLSRLISYLAT